MLDALPPGTVHAVGCTLGFELARPSVLALQIAPSTRSGPVVEERFDLWSNDDPGRASVRETAGRCGGRVHLVHAPAGPLTVAYSASLRGAAPDPGATDPAFPLTVPDREPSPGPAGGAVAGSAPEPGGLLEGLLDEEVLEAMRQSRYCPSDEMARFAHTELGHLLDRPGPAAGIASWVFERLAYVPGSSGGSDTAVDTLLTGRGVCRDFAHLTVTLCRALGVPARLVSAYAPGLGLMDFHAVVEVRQDHGWEVVDATRLAPRPSLVRIATGRDAADTALAATVAGDAELVTSEVFAVVAGDLPLDEHRSVVALA